MSRRETIILAALVNAGLLLVLFATARHSGDTTSVGSEPTQIMAQMEPLPMPLEPLADADPVANAAPLAAVTTPAVPPSTTYFVPQPPTPVEVTPMLIPAEEVTPEVADESPVQAAPKTGTVNVTVKQGDALEKIARRNHTTVAQIMRLNGLTGSQLKIGQVLKVPASGQAQSQSPESSAGTETAATYYTVKQGDNPWLIANRNHIAVSELLRLNNLDDKSARRLKPGDRLRVH